jgi:hypothetical protein
MGSDQVSPGPTAAGALAAFVEDAVLEAPPSGRGCGRG